MYLEYFSLKRHPFRITPDPSLFFPGGTRSRSGGIEKHLKLGLLGTALDAQYMNYLQHGDVAKKIIQRATRNSFWVRSVEPLAQCCSDVSCRANAEFPAEIEPDMTEHIAARKKPSTG